MALRKALLIAAATMAVVVVGALLPATASVDNYKVGDDKGWKPDVDYHHWAAGKDFKVGDTLEFVYSAGSHNVVLADEASYNSCTLPIGAEKRTMTSGDDSVTLGGKGRLLFISTILDDCDSGMKLAVNVR